MVLGAPALAEGSVDAGGCDVRLLPYHRFELSSPMKANDALDAMRARTEPVQWFRWQWPNSNNDKRFEGEITATGFNVRRVLGYRNSFAPRVIGEVQSQGAMSRIVVTMRPHAFVLAFVAVWVALFGVGVWFSSGGAPWFAALMIVAGYLLVSGGFWFEANKQEGVLREIFRAI